MGTRRHSSQPRWGLGGGFGGLHMCGTDGKRGRCPVSVIKGSVALPSTFARESPLESTLSLIPGLG